MRDVLFDEDIFGGSGGATGMDGPGSRAIWGSSAGDMGGDVMMGCGE